MESKFEFELSQASVKGPEAEALIQSVEKVLRNQPLSFASVFMVQGQKYIFIRKDAQHILIEPLTGISSLLASRAIFLQTHMKTLTHIRGLNHNVRGSLSGIRSRIELLGRQLDDPTATETGEDNPVLIPASQIREGFEKILNSADKLQQYLADFEQVLDWLNPEQDITMLLPVQVLETIQAYMSTDLFVKRNVRITIQPTPPVRIITIHPTLFVEPILHILDNAVESLRPGNGGNIHLSVSSSGSDCILEIQNDGPSLPDPPLDMNFFEPGTGAFPDGPGMGLSFSRWLVEASGGEISLLKNEESNVIFRLRYPRRL